MKKLKSSSLAKVIAVLLLIVMVAAMAAAFVGVVFLEHFEAYNGNSSREKVREAVLENRCEHYSYAAISQVAGNGYDPDDVYIDGAFCFVIEDEAGNVVYDNLEGRSTQASAETMSFYINNYLAEEFFVLAPPETDTAATPKPTVKPTAEPDDEDETADSVEYNDNDPEQSRYSLTGYILETVPEDSGMALILRATDMGYTMRYGIFAIMAGALLAAVLLFVFLMSAAGHKAGTDEIKAGFLEKIPFDIFTAAVALAESCLIAVCGEISYNIGSTILAVMLGCFAGAVFMAIGIIWCMSWAVRIKQHTALKGCLCYKVLAWMWKWVKKFFTFLGSIIKGLPLISRAALITLGILVVEFFFICIYGADTGSMLVGWFLERAVLVALLLYALIGMKKLLAAGKEIASGNMNYTVDTSKMRGVVKEHGEDLNNISAGLNKAVGERMKSERFKTELITNVSHDIRTPLTSIINYVDLLAKENPDSEKEREYIEVLERQSARLKKLIDDLIEASKASTGNLPVNAEKCEMPVLLGQIAGEYTEKLQNAQLELVQSVPEEQVTISADGRHMWRIFDNLLNNACKYSMSGTRVYLTLEKKDGKAVVSVKNISKTQLNISGDELTERFVRGDSARNTEGSGLGLSIARSLTQLQKGEMSIDVDGDLFKVTLYFPVSE